MRAGRRASAALIAVTMIAATTHAAPVVVLEKDATTKDVLDKLRARGARILAERPTQYVIEMDAPGAGLPEGTTILPGTSQLQLRGRRMRAARAGLVAKLRNNLQIVQFRVPVTREELTKALPRGARVVSYVPDNAYLIWTDDSASREELAASSTHPLVQGTQEYTASDSLSHSLERVRESTESVRVGILMLEEPEAMMADLDWLLTQPDIAVQEGPAIGYVGPMSLLIATLPGNRVDEVAALPTVISVQDMPGMSVAGESADMIIANQTKIVGGNEVPKNPVQDGIGYLQFLADRLTGFDHTDPLEYPIAVVVDTGFDEGGSPSDPSVDNPRAPDFHEFGNPAGDSRIVFSFRWDYDVPDPNYQSAGTPTFEFDGVFNTAPNTAPFPYDPEDPVVRYNPSNTGASLNEHGHFVASMLGGYNDLTGPANEWTGTGLNWGIGTSPYGRIGNAKMDNLPFTFDTDPNYSPLDVHYQIALSDQFADAANPPGAHTGVISQNSWILVRPFPTCGEPGFDWGNINNQFYDLTAMTLDARTRDAQPDFEYPESGSNPMLFVTASGNGGYSFLGEEESCAPTACVAYPPRTNTILSPALAKNVLTVGASENIDPRPGLAFCLDDPCFNPVGSNPGRADDADDVAYFSGKGSDKPGARIKPDVVAPGAFVYANIFPEWLGCPTERIPESAFPRVYGRSFGTSFSAPAVSGMAQVCAAYLNHQYGIPEPSPALLKAYVIHTGKFLRGVHTGPLIDPGLQTYDTAPLPSPYQGFGRVDLGMALDGEARYMINQSVVLDEVGDHHVLAGYVVDPGKPVRAALVWTDAISYIETESYFDLVNDLDMEMLLIGNSGIKRYYGNLFDQSLKEYSRAYNILQHPARDSANNVECIFLPPQGHAIGLVKIQAKALNGDALDLTYMGTTRRQDFALVLYNFIPF